MRLKIALIFALALLLLLPLTSIADSGNMESYAGGSQAGYGDGHRLEAQFNNPYGLALDRDNSLLIADSFNHRIRKVVGEQVITLAGYSDSYDKFGLPQGCFLDGTALEARFNNPRDLVVDSKGSIFVADTNNHVIRKISNGKVSTFAGTGSPGYKDGVGPQAQFNFPSGLAIDKADNLYVADTINNLIRVVTPQGVVATFAGKYSSTGGFLDGAKEKALFNEPSDLVFGPQGGLFVLDAGNQLVRKIDRDQVQTFAGKRAGVIPGTNYYQGGFQDGPLQEARFNFPKGITVTEDGTFLIADTYNHRIRAIINQDKVITVAGTGIPGDFNGSVIEAQLNGPVGVLYAVDNLYISDIWNNAIRKVPLELAVIEEIGELTGLLEGIKLEPSENIQVFVDKKAIVFFDVNPFIENGKTMVPLRQICEEWGARVDWSQDEQTVTVSKGNWQKSLNYVNDPLVLHNQRTMVHIRFLAESMGFRVEWLPQYKAVLILSRDN